MNREMTGGVVVPAAEPRLRPWDWGALALLVFGPFLAIVGWLVGVWLLWASNRWTWVWKIVGTLAWPLGLAAAVGAERFQPPLWLSVAIATVVEFALLIAVFVEARNPKAPA